MTTFKPSDRIAFEILDKSSGETMEMVGFIRDISWDGKYATVKEDPNMYVAACTHYFVNLETAKKV